MSLSGELDTIRQPKPPGHIFALVLSPQGCDSLAELVSFAHRWLGAHDSMSNPPTQTREYGFRSTHTSTYGMGDAMDANGAICAGSKSWSLTCGGCAKVRCVGEARVTSVFSVSGLMIQCWPGWRVNRGAALKPSLTSIASCRSTCGASGACAISVDSEVHEDGQWTADRTTGQANTVRWTATCGGVDQSGVAPNTSETLI